MFRAGGLILTFDDAKIAVAARATLERKACGLPLFVDNRNGTA